MLKFLKNLQKIVKKIRLDTNKIKRTKKKKAITELFNSVLTKF